MDQYIGKFLDDRYEILEVIGSGGMAVVYKAKCHRLNRMVAIKILRPDLMMDDEIRRRFHAEAQAVAMLSSPNIVSVYDVGQYAGADYIVMELIEGITLKEYMQKRGGCLNWREALHFMNQIMQALRHAHSRGIVHRDIKPQNIMVLRDGSVKVADFGIARIMDSQKTMTQEAFGSVHYVSPEQAKGEHVDARSDIYSAGVVLYEMLTGCLPFDGDTAVSIALQHINSTPATPRTLNPDIPVGLEQICMQSMCARLDLRYPDAQSVLRDLDEFRRNPSIVFPYDNPWGNSKKNAAQLSHPSAQQHTQTISHLDANAPAAQPANQNKPDPGQDTITREELEDELRRRKNRTIFTCAVIAIIVVIFLIFFLLWRNFLASFLDTGEVLEVPSLLDMTIDEAKEYIATECGGHFTVTCTKAEFSDTVEVGHIISQTPTGGSTTKSESTEIQVVISSGVQDDDTLYMPSLVREDYRTAQARLENEYNVKVELGERVYSDTIDEDLIVSTDPVAGSPLTEGQTVILYVSQGPEVTTSVMPNLYGMTEEQAQTALDQLDLELGSAITVAGSEKAGTVIYQSVKANTDVTPGTVVYLQLSDGSLASGSDADEEEQDETTEETTTVERTDESTQDTTTETEPVVPKYQISVTIPAATDGSSDTSDTEDSESSDTSDTGDLSDSVTVTIYVNNEETPCLNSSFPRGYGTVTTFYSGEIDSITVYIDGVQTNDFDYVEVSQ